MFKHELHNDGIVAINMDAALPGQRTLIVLGAPRGGTTMVAGVFAKLGVFMGERLTPATYEDDRLLKMIGEEGYDAVHELVEVRNSQHDIWGWKQPNEYEKFFTHVLGGIRNPVLFVVVRDVVAIANRNRISALSDITSSMFNNLRLYESLLTGATASGHPCVLISYEKALLDPEAYVHRMAEFAGNPAAEQMDEAVAFIQPSPADYLESARVTNAKGAVNIINCRRILGWAFFTRRPETPVQVELFVNGRLVSSAEASIFRKDVLENKLHPNGNCGYDFLLEDAQWMTEGDEVQVRVIGDTKFLGRGTYIFQPPNEH